MEDFLERLRVRGGLFVIRTGDYFGFFHRTFQEYFAARHILNVIKGDKRTPNPRIETLANKARSSDDLWREAFLLAVAYQSGEDEHIARTILSTLLTAPQGASFASWAHDLLLAAECLLEAQPATIGAALERQIAEQLLQTYEQAQRQRKFDICGRIESAMQRWLLSLPKEAYRPTLLVVLTQAVCDAAQPARQQATLTLLTIIAQQLTTCPDLVFDTLIPPLLALAGLPAVGKHLPAPGLAATGNLTIADLSLTVLSFMDKRGPAGLLLPKIRQYFKDNAEQLRHLALYSLACGTLITPAVVPFSNENYQQYEDAIKKWMTLRDSYNRQRITASHIETCKNIHEQLLSCTEEVTYPATLYLLAMLQRAAQTPDQWQRIWQSYLLEQLNTGQYIAYQEAALLWTMLFPDAGQQKPLGECILKHYKGSSVPRQQYAQRFIAALSIDLRNLRNLRNLILIRETAEQARISLPSQNSEQDANSMIILMGRLLHVQEEVNTTGVAIERETQEIVQKVCEVLAVTKVDEVRKAALDVLWYLPARTSNEINSIRQLAEGTTDQDVRNGCAYSLGFANPQTQDQDAKAVLVAAQQSSVETVRRAAEEALIRIGRE